MRLPFARNRRWLDARPLIAGVALVVAALGLLAFWAWQASIRRHEVSLDLLRSHADLAAQRLGARIQNELYIGGMAVFRPIIADRARRAPIDPHRILDAAHAAEACRCVSPMKPAYALRTDLTPAGTAVAGSTVPSAHERDAIVAAMRDQISEIKGGWDIAVLRDSDVDDGRVVLFARAGRDDQLAEYIAFATDSATLREFVIWPLMCQSRLVNVGADPPANPNDSILALQVADSRGRGLYRTTRPVDAQLASTAPFPVVWGSLTITASLRPAAIEGLLPGGVPRSPIPTLVALVVVAATLAGLAMLLLWRMHELSRLRTDFTSSVSHELRTPLTQILLYAETIEMGRQRSRAKRTEAIGVITRETRRLIHLVENVLQFSRAERHLTRLSPRAHELGELAAEAVSGFLPVAEARRAAVALRLDGPVHAAVDGDAVRRILLNLLDNAVRYGPDGQTVVVAVERAGSWARVSVSDEGMGIAPNRRDDVWKPFVRLDARQDDSTTGCGIGLAIVSELVELHRGRRSIQSRAGGGSIFTIEFPAAQQTADRGSTAASRAATVDPPLGASVP
jgi:signal transduction histidine kinase